MFFYLLVSSRKHCGSTYGARYGNLHVEPQCLRLGRYKDSMYTSKNYSY